MIPNWGGGVSNMWSSANDMYAHNDELTFSDKLTKIAGAHGLKFGATLSRLQKQQNFNNNEEMYLVFVQDPGWNPDSTGNAVGDILTGRITQVANAGSKPPEGEFRMWNIDFFAQDSWKVKPNFTLEVGVRAGYWTNNAELNGLGAYFDQNAYDPTKGEFLDPGTFQRAERLLLHQQRLRARRHPRATAARSRCRASTSRGTSTARATTCSAAATACSSTGTWATSSTTRRCSIPPAAYQINADVGNTPDPGGTGRGLTYDTLQRHPPGGSARRGRRSSRSTPDIVHLPEDAQLQRLVRAAHLLATRCSRRPTSARAAATWSAASTATRCRKAR